MNSLLKFKKLALSSHVLPKLGFMNFRAATFVDSFRDKEKMEEKIYIDKKERELMKKLLERLNTEEQDVKVTQQEQGSNEDKENLDKILKKHKVNIPQELFNDIIHWKKGEY